ncbi:MAG: sensor histidine kinase, partial [Desulfomonilaceae bacterium]
FSPDGGEILVAAQIMDGSVSVSISDQGPGIDPRYHEAIFEKFFQISSDGDAPLHKGSAGIGLAICKGIVEAHGGRIWVESRPGLGSTFVFSIPIGDIHERRTHTSGR